MKVTLGQINTTPGDFENNTRQIHEVINKAHADDSDMVVFPELSIPGYLTCDKMFQKNYVRRNRKELQRIVTLSEDMPKLHIVVGYIGINNTGNGKLFTNMLAVIKDGTIIGEYQKQLLPFYDVFDEGRYYEPGNTPLVLRIGGRRVGFTICEDMWNDKGQDDYNHKNNPIEMYRKLEVSTLVNISSSPYVQDKPRDRKYILESICNGGNAYDGRARHADYGFKHIVYVNQQGGQDELVFDGRSCVVSDGSRIRELLATECKKEYAYETIDLNKYYEERHSGTDDITELFLALTTGLRDYIKKSGFSKVVVGSSGGIDSAVVIALACEAIGPENVIAVRMPAKWSSQHSLDDAAELHKNYGCVEHTVSIEHLQFINHINAGLGLTNTDYYSVADENIQARIRGMVIMHYSNATGALALTTGNKTECAVGYSTLYGDMCGGFNPIKDLYKLEVYEIAKYINDNRLKDGQAGIPTNIIDKAPSAELAPDQTDEESLLPYHILDTIVYAFVEHFIDSYDTFVKYAQRFTDGNTMNNVIRPWIKSETSEQDYYRMINLINKSEFKRRQAAPGIKVSKVAFGTGRRLPIVAK